MANSLVEELFSQLQGAPMQQISSQLGTSPEQTSSAIGAALPMILGALGRNASQPQGADALFNALGRDHNNGLDLGSVLGAMLGGGAAGGAGGGLGNILGSVLGGGAGGGRGAPAGGGLGDLLGGLLGGGQSPQAGGGLPSLGAAGDADGILGHIFGDRQQRAENGLGQATGLGSTGSHALLKILAPVVMAFLAQRFMQPGASAGGLGQALSDERQQIGQQGGLGGGLMNAVLDQDGDGDVDLNDLIKLGGGLLGGRR
ncbi:MAG: DUF937 domain-containing protein [Lautropia sp.]